MMTPRTCLALIALSAALLLTGCGESWHVPTQPVVGRVTVNGEPPAGALVQLISAGEPTDIRNTRPVGLVQADGTYTLRTYEDGDGAPVGEYHFTLVWPEDPTVPSFFDRLDHKYDKPEKSGITITVRAGEKELEPVAITGAKVTMTPPPRSGRGAPLDVTE